MKGGTGIEVEADANFSASREVPSSDEAGKCTSAWWMACQGGMSSDHLSVRGLWLFLKDSSHMLASRRSLPPLIATVYLPWTDDTSRFFPSACCLLGETQCEHGS